MYIARILLTFLFGNRISNEFVSNTPAIDMIVLASNSVRPAGKENNI